MKTMAEIKKEHQNVKNERTKLLSSFISEQVKTILTSDEFEKAMVRDGEYRISITTCYDIYRETEPSIGDYSTAIQVPPQYGNLWEDYKNLLTQWVENWLSELFNVNFDDEEVKIVDDDDYRVQCIAIKF